MSLPEGRWLPGTRGPQLGAAVVYLTELAVLIMFAVILGRIGSINRPLVSVGFARKMGRRFVAMGKPQMMPEEFIAMMQLCALLFGILGLMVLNLLGKPLIAAVFFALFGALFAGPDQRADDVIPGTDQMLAEWLESHVFAEPA